MGVRNLFGVIQGHAANKKAPLTSGALLFLPNRCLFDLVAEAQSECSTGSKTVENPWICVEGTGFRFHYIIQYIVYRKAQSVLTLVAKVLPQVEIQTVVKLMPTLTSLGPCTL